MAVFRVNKDKNYTVMSNYHLNDKHLSLKAIGLLSKMLSLPKTWDYSVNGLVAICKESKTAIQGTLKELEECGYLKRTKTHDKRGRIDYIYDVYEKPNEVQTPQTENPITVNPYTENEPQLNTNESNTKESNTKNKKKVSKGESYDNLIESYTDDDDLRQALKAFIQMRKLIKKPLTNYALKLILNKLDKMVTDSKTKTAIVNQSVEHSWQGVFPLKEEKTNKPPYCTNESKPSEMKPVDYTDFVHEGPDGIEVDIDGYKKACEEYNKWADSTRGVGFNGNE